MSDVTLDDKIACLKRELAMRQGAYPRFVLEKRMSKEKADREIEVMREILRDYVADEGTDHAVQDLPTTDR